jgi:solute carrier family 39 (zinc transporter), member 1/2/3
MLAGYYPFYRKIQTKDKLSFPIGEALAAGVFLGAGLIHMLGDAAQSFYRLGYDYPIPFLITGMVFLVFLLLEHIGKELYQHQGSNSSAFAILAMVMLSIHSFFTGAALGLGDSTSVVIMILLAITAHKWAESFALAIQINKSPLPLMTGLGLFGIFSLMVPAGILLGSMITHSLDHHALMTPIFSAVAAGTFLYLGTLHGLEQATLIKQCCNLHRFYFVMLGFTLMAVVAIWT